MSQNLRSRTVPTLLLCSALVAGCAGPKPLVTDAEIAAAEASNTLPSLYNQAKATLVGKDRNAKKNVPLYAQLDNIGRRLGSRLDYDLRRQLEAKRLSNQLVPLAVLTEVQSSAESMRTWEPARFDVLNRELVKEVAATQKAIGEVEAQMAALPDGAYRKRMEQLRQLELLTGDTRHGEQREAMLRKVRGEFEQARATDNFEIALVLLDELPPGKDIEPTRLELQTRLFESKFNDFLAQDRPDDAYSLFDTLARSPYFDEVKGRIGPTARNLVTYFLALAANDTQSGNLALAYQRFSQARNVRLKLDGRVDPVPEEKPFVDRAYRGYEQARNEGRPGLAYGHLLLVQEFDPDRLNLGSELRAVEDETNNLSIRTATVQSFSKADGIADYAGALSTRITEALFQTIPEDIRIIAADNQATAVDYHINGSIDEARVEGTENKTRKTERVVTEQGVVSRNPKYDEWMRLPDRERRNTPPPPAQLVSDRKEDITYMVTSVRKVGYFSAAFRVVEAATGKVMYTDSVTVKREFTGEGNEGVSLGTYSLPAKTASVPTDIEILSQLSTAASQEIGKRLAVRIGDLEKRYADAGKQAAASGNNVDAATYYGYAVTTGSRKVVDTSAYRAELKRSAAASGYGR